MIGGQTIDRRPNHDKSSWFNFRVVDYLVDPLRGDGCPTHSRFSNVGETMQQSDRPCRDYCYENSLPLIPTSGMSGAPGAFGPLHATFPFRATGSLLACIDFMRAADDAPSSDSP